MMKLRTSINLKQRKSSETFLHLLTGCAFLLIALSSISEALWVFVPVAFMLVLSYRPALTRYLSIFLAVGVVLFASHFGLLKTDLDVLTLPALFLGGALMALYRDKFQALARGLGIFYLVLIVACFGWFAKSYFSGTAQEWSINQLETHILPPIFQESAWSEEMKHFYTETFRPLFIVLAPSAFCFMFVSILIFNLLLYRIVDTQRAFKGVFWEKFSRWRPSDWILAPLVLGLTLMALSYDNLSGEVWSWKLWFGWNLTLLSLFPISLNGLSFFSYLLPRMGLFFVIFTVFLFVFLNPYPILILAGWADIWFDFRRRMRSNPKSE